MKTIQALIGTYVARTEEVQNRLADVGEGKLAGEITIPSFKEEVIIPLIEMLAIAMEGEKVEVPDKDTYHQKGGLYRIKIGLTVVGGLSYPVQKDTRIYYTPLFRQKVVGERVEINSVEQLAGLIRRQLKERRNK